MLTLFSYVLSYLSHLRLFAPLLILPGSSVHGMLQASTPRRLPCPAPGDLPAPGTSLSLLRPLRWQAGSLPLAPPFPLPLVTLKKGNEI